MGGIFTLVFILLPLIVIEGLIEFCVEIPEKIRDRRAMAFLRGRTKNYW